MTTIYKNFTEALKQLFTEDEIVAEVGPGIYIYPTISIFQYINPKFYIAIDGATSFEDCWQNFNQIGGLEEYLKRIKEYLGNIPTNLLSVCSFPHLLPLKSKSVDSILFVKTLWKLTDGTLNSWDKMKNSIIDKYSKMGISYLNEKEYKQLSILTYELLVLEEARRVGRKGIAIIPESESIEEEMIKDLKIYSEIIGDEFSISKVESPTWTIKRNEKEEEIGHWQENSSRSIIYFYMNGSKPISRDELIEYLRRSKYNLCESKYFGDLCYRLF
jgi:hypothetical protein